MRSYALNKDLPIPMKYLLIILFILCAVSLATLFAVWPKGSAPAVDPVVTINDRPISREEIQSVRDGDRHHGNDEGFIDEYITRQLLIAEAQRRNIDKEPGFRKALKNYYEHSLIKILMDRVSDSGEAEVSEAEIDAYLDSFGRTFTFHTLETSGEVDADIVKTKGDRYVSAFEDLSGPLQLTLAGLKPGETTTTFVTGNDKIAVYLEKVEGEPTRSQNIDRGFVRQQLRQEKIEKLITAWIEELRQKASITYHSNRD